MSPRLWWLYWVARVTHPSLVIGLLFYWSTFLLFYWSTSSRLSIFPLVYWVSFTQLRGTGHISFPRVWSILLSLCCLFCKVHTPILLLTWWHWSHFNWSKRVRIVSRACFITDLVTLMSDCGNSIEWGWSHIPRSRSSLHSVLSLYSCWWWANKCGQYLIYCIGHTSMNSAECYYCFLILCWWKHLR